MLGYGSIFEARGSSYNDATRLCPDARARERELLIERLAPRAHHRVCDAPAGGGYLAEGLAERTPPARIICIDPSRRFVRGVDAAFTRIVAPLEALPLADDSVDRVGSLAGLHHLERKGDFLGEAFRVLAPGGRIAVADVLAGSPVAGFLNDTVDRFTETGHAGIFLEPGELTQRLEAAGFVDVSEKLERYEWCFPDVELLLRYCKLLFGLVKADLHRVRAELERHLGVEVGGSGARLPWSLVYACATKPDDALA